MEVEPHICIKDNGRRCATCESNLETISIEIADYLNSNECNEELLDSIIEKVRENNDLIHETEESFKYKLQEAIQFAKDDIDLRVESLKTELDVIRESLFENLDKKEDELLNYFNLKTESSKLTFPSLSPRREQLNELLERMKKSINKIQELFDISFSVKFEFSNFEISSEKFGKIVCGVNQQIPKVSWKCHDEWEFNEENFNGIRTFHNPHNYSIKSLKNAGLGLLASIDENEKLKLWDLNTGVVKHISDLKCYETNIFLNESNMVCTESIGTNGFRLYDLKTMQSSFYPTQRMIRCLEKTDDGLLITGEETKVFGSNCIRIWRINGTIAEVVGKIEHSNMLNFIRYIGTNMIAVMTNKDILKIYDLEKCKEIKSFQKGHVKDVMRVSEDHLAMLTVCEIFIHDIKSDKTICRIARSDLYHARSAMFISLFRVKLGQFGVYTSSYAYVFDSISLKCIANVSARTFHAGSNIDQLITILDGRFASSNKSEISFFDFKFDDISKRKIDSENVKF